MSEALTRTLRAMRDLGFFEGLDEPAALAKVRRKMDEEWGEEDAEAEPSGRSLDFAVLSADEESAWWRDCECDCLEGNGRYVEWANGLAGASRGTLRLDAATEAWLPGSGGEERVRVTLRAGRRSRVVVARDFGDYVDAARLVDGLNALLPRRGPRYRSARTGDQTAFIVFADDAQARGLEARGWAFHTPEGEARRSPGGLRGAAARWWEAFAWPFRA